MVGLKYQTELMLGFWFGGRFNAPIFLVYSVTHFRIYCQGKIAFFITFLNFLRKIASFPQKNRENYFFFSVLGCELGAKSRKNAPRQATHAVKLIYRESGKLDSPDKYPVKY